MLQWFIWEFSKWFSLNSLNLDSIQNSVATRDSQYLTKDIFLYAVVNKIFPLLSLVRQLVNVVRGNRHQSRGNNINVLSITATGNGFVASWVLPLETDHFWTLSWFIEFTELSESHLEKILLESGSVLNSLNSLNFSSIYGKFHWIIDFRFMVLFDLFWYR